MFKYLASGGLCAIAEYGILVLTYGRLQWNVHLANLTALTTASLLNYFLSRYWIFGRSCRAVHFEFMLFMVVTALSFAMNHLLFLGLHLGVGWDYRVAKALTIAVVVCFNYSAKKFVVFKGTMAPCAHTQRDNTGTDPCPSAISSSSFGSTGNSK